MEILDLKEDQYIIIEKTKYRVLNKVKFTEKSSYWIEYKIRNTEDNEIYYLNVELSSKVVLFKVLKEKEIQLKVNIFFQGEEYELMEKGIGKVEDYYGMTDVGLKEEVSYYEYKNKKDMQKVLSIEKWKDETEISLGKIISLSNIKILNEFER